MAQTIIVDISTRGANPVAYTHQGDTGRTFFAEIYENGEPFAVAGYTIKVGAILPADRGYYVIAGNDMVTATKTNDNTTNKIYFTLSDKYSLKAGNGILTLIFTSNTGTPSTIRPINIDLRIQKSADADDTIAGASDFPEGLEAIAEEVFQEYLSTYLPPVAPSASAAANKAADAKLTGEALDDLKSDLEYKTDNVYGGDVTYNPLTLISGSTWNNTGNAQSNNARARTEPLKYQKNYVSISAATGYNIIVYSNNDGAGHAISPVTSGGWMQSYDLSNVDGKYLFVIVKRTDNADLTSDDLSGVVTLGEYSEVLPYALQQNVDSADSIIEETIENIVGSKLFYSLERGNLTYASGNTPTASSYNQNYRARTPVDKPISLKTGARISVKDADNYLVEIYYYTNGSMVDTAFVTQYVMPSDQDVWILVRIRTESGNAIPVEQLREQLVIETSENNILNERITEKAYVYPIEIGGLEQTARIGWNVYSSATPPEQSIPSYALAYKNGCRIMLCDMRVTNDGVFVCRHDDDLGGNTVMNADGTALTAEEKAYKIADLTASQLDTYDFGIYKGSKYAGTKILRFVDLLKFCKVANCRVFVETKVSLTSSQVTEIIGMIKKHGMQDMIIWGDLPYAGWGGISYPLISNSLPNSVVCVRATASTYEQCVQYIEQYATADNHALMIFDDYTLITEIVLDELMGKNIDVGYTEIKYATTLDDMVDSGIIYNIKNVASSYFNLGKYFGELYGL